MKIKMNAATIMGAGTITDKIKYIVEGLQLGTEKGYAICKQLIDMLTYDEYKATYDEWDGSEIEIKRTQHYDRDEIVFDSIEADTPTMNIKISDYCYDFEVMIDFEIKGINESDYPSHKEYWTSYAEQVKKYIINSLNNSTDDEDNIEEVKELIKELHDADWA